MILPTKPKTQDAKKIKTFSLYFTQKLSFTSLLSPISNPRIYKTLIRSPSEPRIPRHIPSFLTSFAFLSLSLLQFLLMESLLVLNSTPCSGDSSPLNLNKSAAVPLRSRPSSSLRLHPLMGFGACKVSFVANIFPRNGFLSPYRKCSLNRRILAFAASHEESVCRILFTYVTALNCGCLLELGLGLSIL